MCSELHNFPIYTIKMSAQEYVSEVEKLFCLVSHLENFQSRWLHWILTRHLSRHSIDLKGIIIHMYSSVDSTVSKEHP